MGTSSIVDIARDPNTTDKQIRQIIIFHRSNIEALVALASRDDLEHSHIVDLMAMEHPLISRALVDNPTIDEYYTDYAIRFVGCRNCS